MDSQTFDLVNTVIILILIIVFTMSILFIITLLYIRKEKQKHLYEIDLLKINNQKSFLSTKLEIQEQTFHHVAREIHDHIGQRLTMARLQVNQVAKHVDELKNEKLLEASNMIEEAIGDLKHLSRSITANLIRDEGLLAAIQLEINRLQKFVPLEINLHINKEQEPPFMPEENELIIYRIVQEAIQNILKHAEATQVEIKMVYSEKHLDMSISDNGIGFDTSFYKEKNNAGKSGLSNLKKRAELLLGSLHIESKPNQGTSLLFQFPHNTIPVYAANQ
ncbi:MAG: sensor histidine kinase [Bacteroidota bacterium]|jgi:two-component system NarL family sensor kinase